VDFTIDLTKLHQSLYKYVSLPSSDPVSMCSGAKTNDGVVYLIDTIVDLPLAAITVFLVEHFVYYQTDIMYLSSS